MKIRTDGTCKILELGSQEIETAIDAYIVAHEMHVSGPRTIRIVRNADAHPDNTNCRAFRVEVFVDPSGKLHSNKHPADQPEWLQAQISKLLAYLEEDSVPSHTTSTWTMASDSAHTGLAKRYAESLQRILEGKEP